MRTTVDIAESLLRQARARAALDGTRMGDVVNQALRLYLGLDKRNSNEPKLPERIEIQRRGRFRLPLIRSQGPGKATVSGETLKAADDTEDLERQAEAEGTTKGTKDTKREAQPNLHAPFSCVSFLSWLSD